MSRPKVWVSDAAYKEWYRLTNREALRVKGRAEARRRREYAAALKVAIGCVDCGYAASPYALDFDHVRGEKVGNVARMLSSNYAWSTIEAEIAKCEVRCANCHRVRTMTRLELIDHV